MLNAIEFVLCKIKLFKCFFLDVDDDNEDDGMDAEEGYVDNSNSEFIQNLDAEIFIALISDCFSCFLI